ncbi:MAG: hypothetical protein NTZ46_10450 [Verrucomicrobia bacterium]|nr:hypothetical protein [Verrucomicrobiota bacterium]
MKLGTLWVVLRLACLAVSARASMDYLYVNPGYADTTGQIVINYPTDYSGGEANNGGMWVGQWNMENPATHETFTAFCLSPTGLMYPGMAAFDPITPEEARYGLNPSTWSLAGGIENAVYLWNLHSSTVASNTEGAALSLALWAALYNSTAVGSATASGRFSLRGEGFTPEMESIYVAYLSELNTAGSGAVESVFDHHPATILRPVNPVMQDLMIPASSRMTPEPSAFFALAALLGMVGAEWLFKQWRTRRP